MVIQVHREEIYLSLSDAVQFTGLRCTKITYLVRHGLLNQYRTLGGHRRYAVSALRGLRGLKDQPAKGR